MSQLNKIQGRFIELRNGLNMNQIEFAELLGLYQSQVSQIETGSRQVSSSIKLKLQERLKVIIDWINTGHGEKFKDKGVLYNSLVKRENTALYEPEVAYEAIDVKNERVPIYDVDFSAGTMLKLIENRDTLYPVGYLSIPEVSGCDAVIRAKGHSMAPRINDGDFLGIKRVDDWQTWIPMGYIYAIDTKNLQIVKYLKKGSSPDTFTIESHNKDFDDDEIPKNVIKDIWSVKTILPFSKIETII